ncbi:hypothetical protein [Actinoallomurus sp. NPDC050550]|uniref:hypothetical protein n=1 Tax=Actinoallomurus sp. NPDC050550 TaxID=3154937 RepID=UPI0033E0512A
MRVSINITRYSWPGGPERVGAELERIVRLADQAGLDTVWVNDHLLQADPTSTWDAAMWRPTPRWASWPRTPAASGSAPW